MILGKGRPKKIGDAVDPGELRRLRQGFVDGLTLATLSARFGLTPKQIRARCADLQQPQQERLKAYAPHVARDLL